MGSNVAYVLRQWAIRAPSRVALVDRGETRAEHRYADLDAAARAFAGELRAAGCAAGDRIALVSANDAAFVAAFMGIAYAGATVVPIPILSAAPEVRFRLVHAGVKLVVHDEARAALVDAAREGTGIPARPTRLLGGAEQVDAPADLSPDAIAVILYTSGTTGKPKGACITHASLAMHTAALVHHELRFDETTRALAVLPLTHSFGIRIAVLCPFYAGGSVVLVPRFDAATSLAIAREERVTFVPAVPTMFAGWARVPRTDATLPWPELRSCLSAGAPLPEEVRAQAAARLAADVRQGYGLTEATFSCIDSSDGPRHGTVGRPTWGVEVAVVDDDGVRVPIGEDGEVVVRGQNVMARYLDDPAATESVFRDGWLRTGDVGRFDPSGALTLVDRTKDLILRGGNNVYPSEVEEVLHRHPSVAEAAVVGIPDEYYGETVVAVVRLAPGATLERDAIDRLCRHELAAFKVPRAYATVSDMPLGPSGKVLKRVLREWLRNGTLLVER